MDDISTSSLFGLLGILLIISAFFSGSETGMMSLNRYKLKHQAKQKNRSAKRVAKLLDRPDRLIGLILIGNNLVNILAAIIAGELGQRYFGHYGAAASTAITTLTLTAIVLIFAEVTPKTFAALYPEKISFPASAILALLMRPFYPFVWAVNYISNGILRVLRLEPDTDEQHLTPDELRTVVHEAGQMIPRRHQEMLLSILDLEKVTVEDLMIPRNEIVALDINDDWKSISRQLAAGIHTKILLYRDTIDDAVGFIHARDALRLMMKEDLSKSNLLRSVRELYYIPEGTPLNVQLLKFQRNKERIGLVVDEYGDIQGLVTLEDILEEIVGDFTTSMTPAPSEEVQAQADGSVIVEGGMNIRDLNKEMEWQMPTDGPKTVNGLILEYLEEIPEPNISIRLAGYPMEILEVQENMVTQVKVYPGLYRQPK